MNLNVGLCYNFDDPVVVESFCGEAFDFENSMLKFRFNDELDKRYLLPDSRFAFASGDSGENIWHGSSHWKVNSCRGNLEERCFDRHDLIKTKILFNVIFSIYLELILFVNHLLTDLSIESPSNKLVIYPFHNVSTHCWFGSRYQTCFCLVPPSKLGEGLYPQRPMILNLV